MERSVKIAELGGQKPKFIEVNCGKVVTVRETPERMLSLIDETSLQIVVLETS